MNSESTAKKWQEAIIADAESKLQRSLKDDERKFITSRGGFIALEIIHDTIKAAGKDEVESYLGSERQKGDVR